MAERRAAFLRGINLGGRRVTNDRLADVVAEAGVRDVGTFLASGNVVFSHEDDDAGALEQRIEAALKEGLGYEVGTLVRSFDELREVVDFAERALDEAKLGDGDSTGGPWKAHVIFLRSPLSPAQVTALSGLATCEDYFPARGREAVWIRRGSMTESQVKAADIERALDRGLHSSRTLNTVVRLLKKFGN